jgi:hypothetical protein
VPGLLSREHGLTVDYLAAVDVVVVDARRVVRAVTARPDDRATPTDQFHHARSVRLPGR